MQLSVIILNYNVRYFLELCVLSVQKAIQNIDAEIIVVDNNSSDDSCAMMKERFPNVKLIENKTNFGFPKGNNIGVDQAKGEYICILNPDTVVAEDTFEKILNTKNWQLNTGIIGCKLIDGTGNFLSESKRGVPTPWVAFTKIFGLYKISNLFGKYYAQNLSENQSGKVDILVGAFMVMKRSLYLEVGGFDENCFMYSDDIDLSYMVKKSGRENYYFAETSVIHYKGESTVRDEKYMKRFQEAMNFFYNKHFKKSLFFSGFMKIGAFVFSKIKKSQQKNRSKIIDNYFFFTKSELQLPLEKPISYQSNLLDFSSNRKQQIEIIFDIQSFSFKEIIDFMQKHKAATITYKMYLPQSKVIIGSNHANDIGEIINLSKIA
ncbi:glycosyl transferase family 2 [Flavobacterium lutivivi]|nr:glycosyl transferase family 2 [Flavobacterium lutivivi]